MKRGLLLLAFVFLLARSGSVEATTYPVVLVHGWQETPASFDAMEAVLNASGFTAFEAVLPGEENVENAQYLSGYVDQILAQTGAKKVNLVGHSMGGLSARYYIKFLGGQTKVNDYIAFGTPQYGNLSGCLFDLDDGGQMCNSSAFLKQLNQGDDTPGAIAYTSLQDQFVGSGALDGGACLGTIWASSWTQHFAEVINADVIGKVIQALNGSCPGTYQNTPIVDPGSPGKPVVGNGASGR